MRRLRVYPSALCGGNSLLVQTISVAKSENPMPYALALIIDVICCCLCGGNNSRQIPRMFEDPKEPSGVGYFMGAIDIGRFVDLETFKARTDAMYDELKAAPTAPGFREIMIPGEIEFHLTRQAEREGIDISPAIEQDFADLAARYGVPLELLQSC